MPRLIEHDKSTPSRLGLYANQLPGVTLSLLDHLTKEDQDDYLACYENIYDRAWINFVSDIQELLREKFHIDLKLVSRETSKFNDQLATGSKSGLRIDFFMPKYARIHVISLEVKSQGGQDSPEAVFTFEDEKGRILLQKSEALVNGFNEVFIDKDFLVEDELFISYNPSAVSLYETENRYFDQYPYMNFDKLSCTYPCGDGYEAAVHQINGGGLNVKFNVYCSIEKFISENINLFKTAFWYRIGYELMTERIASDRFNRFTTLTTERAEELMKVYTGEYDKHIKNSVKNLKITEDPVCFDCKSVVSTAKLLP